MSSLPRSLPYKTPFKNHLSFFDRRSLGLITLGGSLRQNLSLGLDFPVALFGAIGFQLLYGNWFRRPFFTIEISKVPRERERNMLESIDLGRVNEKGGGLDRKQLLQRAGVGNAVMEKVHIFGLWALAADKEGRVSKDDIKAFQEGKGLHEIAERRKDNRKDVLPLMRGGPIWVGGHSWLVGRMFGVRVYQDKKEKGVSE